MRDILIALALSALLTSGAGLYLHNMRVDQLRLDWEAEKATAVAAVKAEVQGICDANNKLTKDKAHDLQNRYDTVARNYDRLRRNVPSGNNQPAAASITGGSDGATYPPMQPLCFRSEDIADVGRQCDNQTAALIILQDLTAAIYKANGQSSLLPEEYNR